MVNMPFSSLGEVWLTRLDPTVGNEIQKTRPCLVVSPDTMNRHLGTVIVMPMTSGGRTARFRSPVVFSGRSGFLLGDQIRSVSRYRLLKCLGEVDEATLTRALTVLRDMFEREP